MKLSCLRFALPFALVSVAAASSLAQNAGQTEDLHGLKVRELHPAPTPTPFPLDVSTGRVQSLEFRTPAQMTSADMELAAASQTEIARRAALQGFRLDAASSTRESGSNSGAWGYEQAVCPAFPDHMLLEYSRNNGPGDVSLFSVVIPRNGAQGGHVRVIPARRRGYSLFTPSASNELTLNDFNHMVRETPSGLSPDWLTLGLCYAALAHGHVRAELQAETAQDETYPLLIPAEIAVTRKGGATVYFADATEPKTSPKDWTLKFAQNGHLLKVTHKDSRELVQIPVHHGAEEMTGVPTQQGAVDLYPAKPGN